MRPGGPTLQSRLAARTAIALAFAIALLVGIAERAPGATGVQVGQTFAVVEADPDAPDELVTIEGDSLPFVRTASSGGSVAQQTTTFTDNGGEITFDSDHSLSTSAGDEDISESVLFQQFTVTADDVPVSLSGTMSDSLSGGDTPDQTVVFEELGGGTLFSFNDGDDPTFSGFGDLAPGTYRLRIAAECASDSSTGACTANLDVRLVLGEDECAPDVPMVGFAKPQGCFTETSPGSRVFETEERAWIGGFEILPRPGGKLVVDTVNRTLSTGGTGADVIFAGFAVPIPIEAIPVRVQDATVNIGGTGTLLGILDLPVEASIKVSWSSSGTSASYEQKVKLDKLTEEIGELVTLSPNESVGESTGSFKATLKNGEGFVLDSAEVAIQKVVVVPKRFRIAKQVELRNLLLKFERRAGKPFWTGQAGFRLPLARGDLDLTGTVFVFDGDLAGLGFEVDGINKRVLGPLFLQKVGGAAAFVPIASPPPGVIAAPEFGYDARIGASVGPRVQGKALISLDGSIQGGSLVSGCTENAARPDPTKLQAVLKLGPLEELVKANLAKVNVTQRACVYPGTGPAAAGIEGVLDGDITFLGAFGYKGTQTGVVSTDGVSYEGAARVQLPTLPELDGSSIISTVGLAACADLTFFEGGFGYRWGGPPPSPFAGCDLGPFRVLRASARSTLLGGGTGSIAVPAGLPHAGFAAAAASGPPSITITGPGGLSVSSPADGSALVEESAVIVPVPHESTTYAFIDDPEGGAYRVQSNDPANPLTAVRLAEGLPEPKVKGKVATGKRKFRLRYGLRRIDGQKVTLYERGEGIAERLGKAKPGGGTIAFKPSLALDRRRTIEAEVIQNGQPRELITVARFKAPKLPKPKAPRVKAKRTKKSLKLSWPKVAGASDYLVEVEAGAETLYRVVTRKRRLRFTDTPKQGKLELTVQALSAIQPPGPAAKLKVKPAK